MAISSAGFPLVAPVCISTVSLECLGTELGGLPAGFGSGSDPAANDAFFLPYRISQPIVVAALFHMNGNAVAGNIDMGLYREDGTSIIIATAVLQAGTNVPQTFDITDTPLAPGRYYLGVSYSSTTATALRAQPGIPPLRALGTFYQATAHPLPAPATFAVTSVNFLPLMGMSLRTLI